MNPKWAKQNKIQIQQQSPRVAKTRNVGKRKDAEKNLVIN